jgi:hypothetical protein
VTDARRGVTTVASFQGGFFVPDAAVGLAAEHVKGLRGSLVGMGRKLSSWQQFHSAEGETRVHFGCDERFNKGPLEPRMGAPFTGSRIEKIVGHWVLLGNFLRYRLSQYNARGLFCQIKDIRKESK